MCNTIPRFKKGVEYYARGLLLRGCKKNFLKQSWASFAAGKRSEDMTTSNDRRPQDNPLKVSHLTNWFKKLIDSTAAEFEAIPNKSRSVSLPKPGSPRDQLLLCGVHAVNGVLEVLGRPTLTKTQVDDLNDNLATEEALILAEGSASNNLR